MNRTPLSPAPLVYAHRGDRSRADDNTLEAFALAVEAGAHGIELDVRSTADDVLIVSHDPSHGDLPAFHTMTFAELRDADPSVPTFEETLRAVPAEIYLNVEIKNSPGDPAFDPDRRNTVAALDMIRQIDEPSRIILSSFDPESVAVGRRHSPDILAGLLIGSLVPIPEGVAAARELGVEALHPPMSSIADSPVDQVNRIRESGLSTVVWNANTSAEIAAAAAAGVDVIITDDPGMARSVLG
ncbi:MAG: glycerophosphodiester phosphodiesterase [Acidimicrobiia bacterium]|nr:glycerophosphodiester phosphodiesterase [Acidimicrobiia bacterium]